MTSIIRRGGAKASAKQTAKGENKKSNITADKSEKKSRRMSHVDILGADFSNGYLALFSLVIVLCAFGLMMVLSSSAIEGLKNYGSSWVFFKRQIVWLILGGIVLWLTLRIDYHRWRMWSKVMIIGSVVLLLIVLIPYIGITVNGSRRWLGYGPLRMQPSEIAKFAVLVFSADLLAKRAHLMEDVKATFRPVISMFVVFMVLVMAQPDMGTTMIIGSITISVLFIAGTRLGIMAKMFGIVIAGSTFLAIVEPYRRERLLSFLHPFNDAGDSGYQVVQSLVGLGSGGIMGVGLGESRAKWGFLPNAHTDFIFAIIGEELGLIGASLVVLLFVGFAVLGVRAASKAPDQFGVLMAAGITAWVVFQAFVNIGAVIGILPVTGVPLPFLSQGGSSLVILMAATGVLLNIARQGEVAEKGTVERSREKVVAKE